MHGIRTTYRYSYFFDKMYLFSSYFTVLVTVSKRSTSVSPCIELLPARVVQFETLKSRDDSVRVGGDNGGGIIHE